MDHKIAIENLKDIRDVLNNYPVKWWLDGGTCLGAIREKDFIAIDDDTDIGVLEETYNDEITQKILDKGFHLEATYGTRDKGYELAFVRNGVKTDIFFYYLKDGKRWYAMYSGKMIPMVYPADTFEEQIEIDFLGSPFKIPTKYDQYLTIKYGDYMTPLKKEEWNWETGPLNIDMDFIK